MARRRSRRGQGASGASGAAQYVKIEQRMVLLAWLNGYFGYERNRDLLADVKEVAEGFDASGRSYVYHLNESGLMTAGKDAVRVIEITKLVEEKHGEG